MNEIPNVRTLKVKYLKHVTGTDYPLMLRLTGLETGRAWWGLPPGLPRVLPSLPHSEFTVIDSILINVSILTRKMLRKNLQSLPIVVINLERPLLERPEREALYSFYV